MGVVLRDVIEQTTIENILEGFSQVCGISTFLVDPQGRPLSEPHGWARVCREYCRSTPEGLALCVQSDREGSEQAARLRRHVVYRCLNAGILDCTCPIIVGRYHVATLMCGQISDRSPDIEDAVRRARVMGISDIDGYLRALAEVPIMSRARLDTVVSFMRVVTETLSELAYSRYLAAHRSHRYMDRLFSSVSDCILTVDGDGRISMASEGCARLMGCDQETIIGCPIESLVERESDREALRSRLADENHDPCHVELNLACASRGRSIPIQAAISRLRDGDGSGSSAVAVLRDISQEKRLQDLRRDLVNMVTHDMSTPVLSVQRAMELLANGSLGALNADQSEIVRMVLATSQEIYGMVGDFMDIHLDESERFAIDRTRFDCADLVSEAVFAVAPMAEEKNIVVKRSGLDGGCLVEGDRQRLYRVCLNLLGNAIKYSPAGSTVKVGTAWRDTGDHRRVALSVVDEGPGIPKQFQELIFEKFFRLDSGLVSGRRGIGLGLSFCRLVVEAHGGSIWVDSPVTMERGKEPHGCRFTFTIPQGTSDSRAASGVPTRHD